MKIIKIFNKFLEKVSCLHRCKHSAISEIKKSNSIMAGINDTKSCPQIDTFYRRYGKAIGKCSENKSHPKGFGAEILKTEKAEIKTSSPELSKELKELKAESNEFLKLQQILISGCSNKSMAMLGENFEEKKNAIIKILKTRNVVSNKVLKEIKDYKSPEELCKFIKEKLTICFSQAYDSCLKIFSGKIKTLDFYKTYFEKNKKLSDVYLEIIKTVTPKSKDKRVLQIENLLKQMYGMDYVNLENIEEAHKILKVIKIARKNNIPMPKNLVVTPYILQGADGLNIYNSKCSRNIFFKSSEEIQACTDDILSLCKSDNVKEQIKLLSGNPHNYSTTSPLHIPMHEFCHSEQHSAIFADNLIIKQKDIPMALKVSNYAPTNIIELETEIRTKSLLSTLTKEEQAFLDRH